ncbi:MAG: FCD domain-containing protein [Oscillospiraceae bacterium]|nr:FCD domain-containing protein [Oscillospiraceae bacterium]
MDNAKAVDAITSYEDIRRIRELLEVRPLELLLFEMGISSGMRIKELLNLRAKDVSGGKYAYFLTEKNLKEAYAKYCEVWEPKPDDFIFRKLRKNEPLAFSAVTTTVKSWFAECGLKGNFTSRSLYKTWEYMSMRQNGEMTPGVSAYALSPIDPNSVQNQVQERLYKAIITGTMPAGTKLVVSRLAQQLDCNMLQVRVALAHLEEQGMVETRSSKTCMVRSLTPRDIHEIAELRILLEGYAMDQVKDKWSAETASVLENMLDKWTQSADMAECVHLHGLFHELLYRDTHMPMLLGYIRNLADRMNAFHIKYYISQHVQNETAMDDEVEAHRELLEHMKDHDFKGARSMILKDVRRGEKDCLTQLGRLEKQKAKTGHGDKSL